METKENDNLDNLLSNNNEVKKEKSLELLLELLLL